MASSIGIPEDDYDIILRKDGKEVKKSFTTVMRDKPNQIEITISASSGIPGFPLYTITFGILILSYIFRVKKFRCKLTV
jgi:hypothetical protein